MTQILQGWNKVLKDYRHWKLILKHPYCPFDCVVFFGNLGHPPNSLDDWVKEMKQLDSDWEKNYYDNLWKLYDGIEEQIDECDKLLNEVDEVLNEI